MQTNDFTEFEAKFYPVNKQDYRKKLKEIGAVLNTPERKMRRTILDHSYYPQISCDYIRVRDEGDLIRLSAKTHAKVGGKLSDQKEIDVSVSDYDKTIKIIEALGFEFSFYQETLRETWLYHKAEIVIDTWPGLEPYTEIEAESEESVQDIAEKLGFDWNKKEINGIKPIYMKVYGLSKAEVTEKISNITFENNPFKNLKKVM